MDAVAKTTEKARDKLFSQVIEFEQKQEGDEARHSARQTERLKQGFTTAKDAHRSPAVAGATEAEQPAFMWRQEGIDEVGAVTICRTRQKSDDAMKTP